MSEEWDDLWNEQSRLMDRMFSYVGKAAREATKPPAGTIRIRLTIRQIWSLLWGGTLLFKANDKSVLLERKP